MIFPNNAEKNMSYTTLMSLLFIAAANGDPTCIHKGTDIHCSAGDADYTLRQGLVSHRNWTTGIHLRECRITAIELDSFSGLPSLEYLDLSRNNISNLKLGVFDGFRRLQALNLSFNVIRTFPLGLFDQSKDLKVLDLKGNKIESIKLGVFDPLTLLRHLDLSSNAILGRNFNLYLFDRSHVINFMDFSKNDMSDTPEFLLNAFHAIDFLNLDGCSLKEVPRFATRSNLKTMKHLMLSANEITKLDKRSLFMHLVELEKLNLIANAIEEIHPDVFKPLKKIELIFLNKNRITIIPETLFHNLVNLNNIDLSNNLIEFVPVNAFRGTNLKELNLADNRFTYLQDNFNLELFTSGARLIKLYFENNPWQCACLNDILVEVKKYRIDYNKDKYKGREPVCVTTQEFRCKRQSTDNQYYLELFENVIR